MTTSGAPPSSAMNKRLQQTQAQVDEVVDIMRVNVDKVLERDQKLTEMDDRADALQAGASQFGESANKLKKKYWWKNMKMWIILVVVVVLLVGIVIGVWIVTTQNSSSKSEKPVPASSTSKPIRSDGSQTPAT